MKITSRKVIADSSNREEIMEEIMRIVEDASTHQRIICGECGEERGVDAEMGVEICAKCGDDGFYLPARIKVAMAIILLMDTKDTDLTTPPPVVAEVGMN